MDTLKAIIEGIEAQYGTGVLFVTPLILFIGAVAKWKLFVKCNQPGIGAIIPIYDFILTLKIVGRPTWHIIYALIPIFNIYFVARLLIELAQSFGKRSLVDYIFVLVFNIFYILNLGLAYDEIYNGPVYGEKKAKSSKPQLA